MTLEFARREAARRDAALGTQHFVVRRAYNVDDLDGNGYMVMTHVPAHMVEIAAWDHDWQDMSASVATDSLDVIMSSAARAREMAVVDAQYYTS